MHDSTNARTEPDPRKPPPVRTFVVQPPRQAPMLEGACGHCLSFIEAQASPTMTRLGLVTSVPRPAERPDAMVCVPAAAFGMWEERDAEVLAAWQPKWLLMASMPRRHRDEARGDLHDALATAAELVDEGAAIERYRDAMAGFERSVLAQRPHPRRCPACLVYIVCGA